MVSLLIHILNDLDVKTAKEKIIDHIEQIKLGKEHYRLKDWGVSRQRYWGCPIPMICPKRWKCCSC